MKFCISFPKMEASTCPKSTIKVLYEYLICSKFPVKPRERALEVPNVKVSVSYCCLSSGICQLGPDEKKQGQVIKIMKTQLKCKDGLRTTFSSSYYLQITYLTHSIIKHYLKIWLNRAGEKNREVMGQHSPFIFCKGKSKKHITTITVRLIVRFVS